MVDLDNVWKWLGFGQKIDVKRVLEKHFKVDLDYKTASQVGEASSEKKQNGGQNRQIMMLNIKSDVRITLFAQN